MTKTLAWLLPCRLAEGCTPKGLVAITAHPTLAGQISAYCHQRLESKPACRVAGVSLF